MPSVFEYTDLVDYLQDSFQEIKTQRPRYSLRSWSQKLGFKSAASVSRILTRTRRPTLAQARTIGKSLKLTEAETLYLEALVQFQGPASDTLIPQLRRLFHKDKAPETLKLSVDNFTAISEWYYTWIQAVLHLDQEFKKPEDFLDVLDDKDFEISQIKTALEKLKTLGLIVQKEGKFKPANSKPNYVEPEAASAAIRNFHRHMLGLAQKSLEATPRDKRDIRGVTIAIKKENYSQAQKILTEALHQLLALAATDDGDQVYHLATAFFPVGKALAKE